MKNTDTERAELYDKAVLYARINPSISYVSRKLGIGFVKTRELLEQAVNARDIPDYSGRRLDDYEKPLRDRISELEAELEAARRAPSAAPVPLSDEMPEGWQMVPIQITEEMEVAAENDYEMNSTYFPRWGGAYQAMLAAAPQPPEAAQSSVSNADNDAPTTASVSNVGSECESYVELPEPDGYLVPNLPGGACSFSRSKPSELMHIACRIEQVYRADTVRALLASATKEPTP